MDPASFGSSSTDVDDTARFARMSTEERLALFLQLCDLTDAIQAGRPGGSISREGHPRSDEALALWARLMHSARDGG